MKYAIPAFPGTRRSLATPRLVAADDIAVEIYYYGHQIPRSSVRYRAVDGIPLPQIIAASCAGMRASAAAYTCRILGIHACSARAAGLLGAQTRRGISREAVHFSDAGVLCARLDIPRRMYSERRALRD